MRDFLHNYYEGRIETGCLSEWIFEVAKCNNCEFIWQTYVLNDVLMKQMYDYWAPSGLSKLVHADFSLFRKYGRQMEIIYDLIKKEPRETNVLDFGSGWGYWCLMAKAYGYNVFGFDIAKKKCEYAMRIGISMFTKFEEIRNYRFDFINAEQVFEHIPNPLPSLIALVDTLNKNGCIRISVPDCRNIEIKLRKSPVVVAKNAIHPLEHMNCFTHQTLLRLGEMAGLQLISQPILINDRFSLASYFKALMRRYYQQYWGTTLYFRKKTGL